MRADVTSTCCPMPACCTEVSDTYCILIFRCPRLSGPASSLFYTSDSLSSSSGKLQGSRPKPLAIRQQPSADDMTMTEKQALESLNTPATYSSALQAVQTMCS